MNQTTFEPAVDPARFPSSDAICFVVRKGELLVGESVSTGVLPSWEELEPIHHDVVRALFIGDLDGAAAFAIEVGESTVAPMPFTYQTLRATYGLLNEPTWIVAGRASQILEWDRTHQFCGRCGERTEPSAQERARRCPECGSIAFPRISPAMIVLVERGDQVLLARGPHHAPGMYALLAGFVETGESLEDAVQREIREEVGIEVEDICYFGSQPWPFPHSLMVGFTAQYRSGEIRIDPTELEDAQWFDTSSMPPVPPRLSIARKLIDYYAEKHGLHLVEA